MKNALPIKNKLFEPEITKEINLAFQKAEEIAKNIEVKDLDYKMSTSSISITSLDSRISLHTNYSISTEKFNSISFIIIPYTDVDLSNGVDFISMGVAPSHIIFGTFLEKGTVSSEPCRFYVKTNGHIIGQKGKLKKDTEYLLSFWFVS